jgi:hypothetical protein
MNRHHHSTMPNQQPVAHGLLNSMASQDFKMFHLSAPAIHDELDWEDCVSSDISTEFADSMFESLSD